jgi:hypothetical protein
MHIMNQATTEVKIMCLVSYKETCEVGRKLDGGATKSRWQRILHHEHLKGELV